MVVGESGLEKLPASRIAVFGVGGAKMLKRDDCKKYDCRPEKYFFYNYCIYWKYKLN